MDITQKAKIRDNFYALIKSTNVSLTFLSHFKTYDIFSQNDLKAMMALNDDLDPMDQAYQFYKRVLRNNFNVFDLLITALENTGQLTASNLISSKVAFTTKETLTLPDSVIPVRPQLAYDIENQACASAASIVGKTPTLGNAVAKLRRLNNVVPGSFVDQNKVVIKATADDPMTTDDDDKSINQQPISSQPKCFVCFKTFESKTAFQIHLKKGLRRIKCHKCGIRFFQECQLNRHLRKNLCQLETNVESKLLSRKKGTFTTRTNIRRHKIVSEVRSQQKVHECVFCKKQFKLKQHLDSHLLTHTKERPWSCDVCSKVFSRRDVLINHLISHQEKKPFSCKRCKKGFPTKSQLQRHSLVHSRLRPHKCSICGKVFAFRYRLEKHSLIHSAKML